MWAIKEELSHPFSEIPRNVQEQVLGILNTRHDQLFTTGNLATSARLYLSGAYLNPGMWDPPEAEVRIFIYTLASVYLKSDLFNKDGSSSQGSDFDGISHVSTFKTVMGFLLETAESEVFHGHKDELTKWKGRATEFKNQLLGEMKMYARQQFPFNNRFDSDKAEITWWQALQGHEFAQILPVSAF